MARRRRTFTGRRGCSLGRRTSLFQDRQVLTIRQNTFALKCRPRPSQYDSSVFVMVGWSTMTFKARETSHRQTNPRKTRTRVLAFTSSRHRPILLRHCIMQMQRQSYPVDHVIYVNSTERETDAHTALDYGILLEDLCHNRERLKIAYGPSGTPHQNHLKAIGLAQIDHYDLFLKVDDDDVYLQDYVLGVVRDFERHSWDYCGGPSRGHLNGFRWKPNGVLTGLGLAEGEKKLGIPDIMPPTLALSQRALRSLTLIKDNGKFEDSQWRRHLVQVPGMIMTSRDEQHFIYHIHGENISTGSWYKD